jgi:hypothetical protein
MVETRAAPRFRVTKPALIEHGGYKIKCAVRDLSVTGASIEIFEATVVPEKFTLILVEDKLKLPCRIVRRTEFRIGVAFE